MDTNAQLQQINTFTKGMNTDTSDLYLPSDQYRMAKNLRFTASGGSNQGELHLIEGNKLKQLTDYNGNVVEFGEILATTNVAQYGVIIDKKTQHLGDFYKIHYSYETFDPVYRDDISPWQSGYICGYIYFWWDGDNPTDAIDDIKIVFQEWFTSQYRRQFRLNLLQQSEFTLENARNGVKYRRPIYCFDTQGGMMHEPSIIPIGVFGKTDNKYILIYESDDVTRVDLSWGVQETGDRDSWNIYRFTNEPNSCRKIFGPCITPIWSGNNKIDLSAKYTHEKDITLYILTGIYQIGSIKLIDDKYEENLFTPSTDILDVIPSLSVILKPPTVQIIDSTSGQLPPARVQYSYRYYTDNEETCSQLSPLSRVCVIYSDVNSGVSNNNLSNKYATITIPSDAEGYENIQIFRIQPDLEVPIVKKIYDGVKLKTFNDYGTDGTDITGFEGYYNLLTNTNVPNVFSSKSGSITRDAAGDRLFYANTKDIVSGGDATFENIDTRSFSSGMYYYGNSGQKLYIIDNQGNIKNLPQSNTQLFHEAFDDNPNGQYRNDKWFRSRTDGVYGGVGQYFDWSYIYEESQFISDLQQQNNTNYDFPTFKYGEVYRFGVILYDLNGIKSSVKWIADIQMPAQPADYFQVFNQSPHNPQFKTKRVGIKFKLKQEIPGCSQFEIVRCIRGKWTDTYNIAQGIVGCTGQVYDSVNNADYFDGTDYRFPYGILSLSKFGVFLCNYDAWTPAGTSMGKIYAKNDKSILQFASPEYLYTKDQLKWCVNSYKSSLKLNFLHNYTPITNFGNYQYLGGAISTAAYSFPGRSTSDSKVNATTNILLTPEWNTNTNIYNPILSDFDSQPPEAQQDGSFENYYAVDKAFPQANICVPREIISTTNSYSQIQNVEYSNTAHINPTTFYSGDTYSDENSTGTFTFNDEVPIVLNQTAIDFVPWSCFHIKKCIESAAFTKMYMRYWSGSNWTHHIESGEYAYVQALGPYSYPVGICGDCMLFSMQDQNTVPQTESFAITVANININANPYGGYNMSSISKSSYYGFGDVYDNTYGIEADVYSGDAYIKLFKYNSLRAISNANVRTTYTGSFTYLIPLVSEVDLGGTSGYLYDSNKHDICYMQEIPWSMPIARTVDWQNTAKYTQYSQATDAYAYNIKYSLLYYAITMSSVNLLRQDSDKRINRIWYSEINNWTQFNATDYIDVDPKYGQITCLFVYKDRLLFWQEQAVGYFSINEKAVVQNSDGDSLLLGTGDLLKKPFYISTMYGMKPQQLAVCSSDYCVYWWDGYNKEILKYDDKSGVEPLSKTKNIRTYLDSGDESSYPHLYYDIANSEIVCNCVNNESIVFNEEQNAFVSIYEFSPAYDIQIQAMHYILSKSNVYINNTEDEGGAKLFGKDITPYLKYIINRQQQIKVFNMVTFAGSFYGNSSEEGDVNDAAENKKMYQNLQGKYHTNSPLLPITFTFKTPLKQEGRLNGSNITNREYDFRAVVPRAGKMVNNNWIESSYGDRLRGRTMECEMKSSSNSTDFSLQYINTKFNISCS